MYSEIILRVEVGSLMKQIRGKIIPVILFRLLSIQYTFHYIPEAAAIIRFRVQITAVMRFFIPLLYTFGFVLSKGILTQSEILFRHLVAGLTGEVYSEFFEHGFVNG